MRLIFNYGLLFTTVFFITGCQSSSDNESLVSEQEDSVEVSFPNVSKDNPLEVDLKSNAVVNNRSAYVASQCYTKTKGTDNKIHNPCFSCHTQGEVPNYLDDSEFQLLYDFRDYSRTNRYTNLFRDRTEEVSAISDDSIMAYIKESNYFDENGNIKLKTTLSSVPNEWDFNENNTWDGYIPDIYFNFDNEGFDIQPDNSDSGWRVFAYAPFLGTFWPTNGSTNDVIIRLPLAMRQNSNGDYSREIYKLNLAIVEAVVRKRNIAIPETDESLYQVDLNANGLIDTASEIVFDWAPTEGRYMFYVGKAKELQENEELHLAAGLYPEGTQFVHTVRYIGIGEDDNIQLANRIKELRYAKKTNWNTYSQLNNAVAAENMEAMQFPDRLRTILGNPEEGISNGQGWVYQGFIEDVSGNLRPQSFEESMGCVGCHSGIGATTDSSFAFPRKVNTDGFQNGWYHWSQKGWESLQEPQWLDDTYEYTKYLIENNSGNEFRDNNEVIDKFFTETGDLKEDMINQLHTDASVLILPSKERALELNKAYKVIVDEQSYIYGRDAHIKPLENVWDVVPEEELTGITAPIIKQSIQ